MAWVIHTQNRSGERIDTLPRAAARRFEYLLNRPGTIGFTLPLDDPTTIRSLLNQSGEIELIAERDGVQIETPFRFDVESVSVRGDHPTITCAGLAIESYLQDALVYGQVAQFSGTTLPWTWINTFQSRAGGSYGITQGVVSGSPATRYKTIQQDAELLGQIVELSETGAGFDFAVDTLRRYREWHPQRGSDNGLHLEYGVNVSGYDLERNAGPGQVVSDVRVTGPDGTTPRTATDATSQAAFGRREAALGYMSDLETADVTAGQLQHYADAAIEDRPAPSTIPSVTLKRGHESVEWGAYWLGDTVRFTSVIGGYTHIDAVYRIVGIVITVDEADNETIDLTLNLA